MSGSFQTGPQGNQTGATASFGISNIIQALLSMVTTLQSIAKSLSAVVFGLTANNTFTGNNTFDGTTTFNGTTDFTAVATFDPPPVIGAGAVGAGRIHPAGLISTQVSATGVGNGADTTDDVLYSYSLPASSLDVVGRGVRVSSFGSFGSTANNKRIQFAINGSVVFGSGTLTSNGGWWSLRAEFYKSATNQQVGTTDLIVNGIVANTVIILATATDTSAMTLAVTGASQTTGAANDVVANGLVVDFLN